MEINLIKSTLSGLNQIVNSVIPVEETAETIVPDSYPDAETVTATPAYAIIRTKECRAGSATISGMVRAKVAYMTVEGESGKAIDVMIPFTTTVNSPAIETNSQMLVSATVASTDSRVLNSRKVLTRANVNVMVRIFNEFSEEYTTEALTEDIIVKKNSFATWTPTSLREKSFIVNDILELPSSAMPAASVMSAIPSLSISETKMIGNKAVFKGDADIAVVYITPDGDIQGATFTLPFSQIVELNDSTEDDECEIILAVTGFDCMVDDDLTESNRKFTCNLSLLAQAVVTAISEHSVIQDLYSTANQVRDEYGELGINTLVGREKAHKLIRGFMETPDPGLILGTEVSFRDQNIQRDNNAVNISAVVDIFITYISHDDVPYTKSVSVDIQAETAYITDGNYFADFTVTDTESSVMDNGVEIRLGVDIAIDCYVKQLASYVNSAELMDDPIAPGASIILRRIRQGDTLWNLAKAYGTTIEAIVALNRIENPDLIYPGQMILIA